MKNSLFVAALAACACAVIMSSCMTEDRPPVFISGPDGTTRAYADQTVAGKLTFTAQGEWTINVENTVDIPVVEDEGETRASGVDWLELRLNGAEKYSGEAGTFSLSIALTPNYTGDLRQATVTITSLGTNASIVVEQRSSTLSGKPLRPSVEVGTQSTELRAGTAGTATFAVTGEGVADGSGGTVTWFSNAAGTISGQTPTGITSSVSNLSDGKATVTISATVNAVQGTYYFRTVIGEVASPVATLAVGAPVIIPLIFNDSPAFDIPATRTGTPIANVNVSSGVSGGRAPYTFRETGLPPGISINTSTGVLSGTPTMVSSTGGSATITVTDSSLPYSQSASITIAYGVISATYSIRASPLTMFGSLPEGYPQPPVAQVVIITNTGSGTVTLVQPTSVPTSTTTPATPGPSNYVIGNLSTTTLPAGAMAVFSVQPKPGLAVGAYNETITVTCSGNVNASAIVNASFTVTAPAPLAFADSATFDIPASRVGTAITNINASSGVSGGRQPYTFSAPGLPTGITINPSTGIISGAPTSAAVGPSGTATITVTDSSLTQQSKSITITYGAVSL